MTLRDEIKILFLIISLPLSSCKHKAMYHVVCLEEGTVNQFDVDALEINSTKNPVEVSVFDTDGHQHFCKNLQVGPP